MASSVPTRAGGSWVPDFRAKSAAGVLLIRAHQYAGRGRALVEGP